MVHGILDLGMLVEDFVDFARVDIEAAGDDHVFLAVHDKQIIVFVLNGHIARCEASRLQSGGGFLRMVPVAFHHQGALDHDFARARPGALRALSVVDVHQAHIRVRPGHPDAAGLFHPDDRVADAQGGGLAHAPALVVVDAHFLDLLDEFHRHGRGPGIEQPQALFQVQLAGLGVVEQGVDQGGHGREKCDLGAVSAECR